MAVSYAEFDFESYVNCVIFLDSCHPNIRQCRTFGKNIGVSRKDIDIIS